MEHFSNDQEDNPNQHKNNDKLCDEMRHLIANQLESQWKLRRKRDQDFPMDGKPLQKEQITSKKEQILASGERNKSKRAGL